MHAIGKQGTSIEERLSDKLAEPVKGRAKMDEDEYKENHSNCSTIFLLLWKMRVANTS